jgi:hypothetical protein
MHELNCDQLNTTKELLDITTWHASGEEAIWVAFVFGSEKTVPKGSWAVLSKAVSRGAKKGAKGNKKGWK